MDTRLRDQRSPPDGQRRIDVGEATLRIVVRDGEIFAVNDLCPHMRLSLEGSKVTNDCFIVCPHHRSAFDLRSGEPRDWTPWPPGIGRVLGMLSGAKPLHTYPTRIEDGHVWVWLDAPAEAPAGDHTLAVTYANGQQLTLHEGMSVLEASVRHRVDHMHACGGSARCTTCRIEVLEGIEHCPPPGADEREVLEMNGLGQNVRLACQLRPTGDITIRVLIQERRGHRPRVGERGIQEVDVAMLFADIRGFTSFAERQLPFDVLHILNRYFDRMGGIVEMHGGGVLSFQGDGIMCIFGLGGEGDAAAGLAVHAAIDMMEAAQAQSAYCSDHFGAELKVGIGIDFGRAVIGEMGYHRNSQLNAIGDVVNTAARLQDLTKEFGSDILISDAVAERARGSATLGRTFTTAIRGKSGEHLVHEVLAA
jgi:class 3 adenylate cyclase/nitrite reductase/ring-hydroxylating ferredoxin subunit